MGIIIDSMSTAPVVQPPNVTSAPLKVTIKKWHAFAAWTWNAGDDVCGICRMPFESAAPDTKYPGDDSPVVWGTCGHAFHLQCITKWLNSHSEQRCPICRRP